MEQQPPRSSKEMPDSESPLQTLNVDTKKASQTTDEESIVARTARQTSRAGKKEDDQKEREWRGNLPKERPGGLAGWVLGKLLPNWRRTEAVIKRDRADEAEPGERDERESSEEQRRLRAESRERQRRDDVNERLDRVWLNSKDARTERAASSKEHRRLGDIADKDPDRYKKRDL